MQATPAPSSPPQSTTAEDTHEELTAYPPAPVNTSSAPFEVLVTLFEKLQSERKFERRRKLLDGWFRHWRQEKGYDLFPVLRLLLPQKDRDRTVYGLKEKNLAKIYIKLIPLGMRDPDAIRLLNWKKPVEGKVAGDFATTVLEVVRKRSSVIHGSLSIDELNDLLDELSANIGKQDLQSKILQRVYNRATALEQQWIVRIIMKDMLISVKETTILSVLHPDAQDLFNICSDLKKVAWELWDPSFRLNAKDKDLQLFHAFAPMLCKRPLGKIEDTVREMGGAEFIIEEKLDGERMQIHKRGNQYFYCSRKGKDYTYLYGKDNKTGSLTPFIAKAFDPRVEDIILDGEMLVWDPVSERNLPFGTLKTAALDKSKKEYNPRPCFKVFDLLYLNGQSLLDKSTKFRKKNMRACLQEIKGRVEFAVEYKAKTAKEVRERMDAIMEARGEGLVIKHPLSKYVLNGRNNDWIKVKPEYMDDMGETVDVLVVAGNYGSGSRSGGVSVLICAVLDDKQEQDNEDDEDIKYSTFVRVGTGFSFADYVWIRSKPWKPWDPKRPPAFLQTAKRGKEDKGDLYLNPEDSFIIKVKAAEVIPTDQFQLGFTMRFPRAISIREDLSIADCMTATSVLDSLRTDRKRKTEGKYGVSKKKRKVTVKQITVLPQYEGVKKKDIAVEANIFQGLKFVVMSDPKSRTGEEDKKTISKMIYANGGNCAQIAKPQPGLFVIYEGTSMPYDLKLVISKGAVDVIKPRWIYDCVEEGDLLPMSKKYFFHATEERMNMDEYNAEEQDDKGGPSVKREPVKKEETPMPMADEEEKKPVVKKEEVDPELAEWFKVDAEVPATPGSREDADDDSATEYDSDNEDVTGEQEIDEEKWEMVKHEDDGEDVAMADKGKGQAPENASVDADVKMGESEHETEYDLERIFRHLCFYLDTPENAAKNGITVRPSKHEREIANNLSEIAQLIIDHGGKVVDLDEPRLTHIVLDKRDGSRRLELMKRTAKPKRRHLVISEYIRACLDEDTLLDEDEFVP